MCIFLNRNDSLGLLDLGYDTVRYFDSISSYQLASGNSSWLAFVSKKHNGELHLLNLRTREEKKFGEVNNYLFSPGGNVLIADLKDTGSQYRSSLIWFDLNKGFSFTVSNYFRGAGFKFSKNSNEVAFLTMDSASDSPSYALKVYKPGMDSAVSVISSSTKGMEGWVVDGKEITFSKNGDKIYFSVLKAESGILDFKVHNEQIKIRGYKTERVNPIFGRRGEAVVLLFEKGYVVNIIRQGSDIDAFPLTVDDDDHYALVPAKAFYKTNQRLKNEGQRMDLYLVSIKDGSKRLIERSVIFEDITLSFSPTGKYINWYDQENREWDVYRVKDGHKVNISRTIPEPLYKERDNISDISSSEGIIGWRQNDSNFLINGQFDIWDVDPNGRRIATNVTSAFGVKNHIRFRVINSGPDGFLNDTMVLSAFNTLSKENGFYQVVLGKNNSLFKLTMGKYIYRYPDRYGIELGNGTPEFLDGPLKAKNANAYLIQRMSANEYPNLFVTSDFRTNKPLTYLEPQEKYIWYTTELIRFSLPNGRKSEGILFKPDNFDSHRKYPVIFYFYERNADGLNIFLHPELSDGNLNISWFASNGYLVFVPDIIYYKSGSPGQCAYEAVNASANVLTQFPWVDSNAMGLQGLSFGGWETNYIITHTSRFRAAASGSSFVDVVSLSQSELGYKWYFISRQGRLGESLWQNPSVYIRNSPIFRADKVSTPLFVMHTINDSRVPLSQAIEFYSALAGMEKKVWFLQYLNEDHLLENENNQLDYSIRLAQFFDHYLKGAPAPKWMTEGGTSLELDTSGRQP